MNVQGVNDMGVKSTWVNVRGGVGGDWPLVIVSVQGVNSWGIGTRWLKTRSRILVTLAVFVHGVFHNKIP